MKVAVVHLAPHLLPSYRFDHPLILPGDTPTSVYGLPGCGEMKCFSFCSPLLQRSETNVLYISIKSYLDVKKVFTSSWARVGQAFGEMAVG